MFDTKPKIYCGASPFGLGPYKEFLRGNEEPLSKRAIIEALDDAIAYAFDNELTIRILGVISAGGTSHGLCLGDLESRGLIDKTYVYNCNGDSDIHWHFIADVIVVTEHNEVFRKHDVKVSPK